MNEDLYTQANDDSNTKHEAESAGGLGDSKLVGDGMEEARGSEDTEVPESRGRSRIGGHVQQAEKDK